MKTKSKTFSSKAALKLLLTAFSVIVIITAISVFAFYLALRSETHARYMGIKNTASEKIAKTAWGMEMNAKNVFDEVSKHLDSPDDVIEALESKADINPEVRGYFAAFELEYFPDKGTWFEPYVHQADTSGKFEVRQVGSARHNYTKSDWYVRAKLTNESFWSDPYYYYDGTSISGHYVTFVRPISDGKGHLVCVCGADMTFEWLTKDLEKIDAAVKSDKQLNKHSMSESNNFYTMVLNNDGSCISHPEGKGLTVTDADVLKDLSLRKSGSVDMDVNGVPCTVYYGPIEHVDWSVAVVVPRHDLQTPMKLVGFGMLLVALIGMIILWTVYWRARYEKAD